MKQRYTGFSIIEAVVVVAIVGTLATVANFSFQSANRDAILDSAVEQVITDFELMRSNASNGVYTDPNTEPVSWGIYITSASPNSYEMVGDLDDYARDLTDVISTRQLSSAITVGVTGSATAMLAFEEFSADYYFNAAIPANDTYIIVTDTRTGNSETITVNRNGLIVIASACGDGVVQPSEQCDDGDTSSNDECSSLCQIEWCGDTFLQDQVRPRNADGSYMAPGIPSMLEKCDKNDPTPNWTFPQQCNYRCQITGPGGGGGGCTIAPYGSDNNKGNGENGQVFLLLLFASAYLLKLLSDYYQQRTNAYAES